MANSTARRPRGRPNLPGSHRRAGDDHWILGAWRTLDGEKWWMRGQWVQESDEDDDATARAAARAGSVVLEKERANVDRQLTGLQQQLEQEKERNRQLQGKLEWAALHMPLFRHAFSTGAFRYHLPPTSQEKRVIERMLKNQCLPHSTFGKPTLDIVSVEKIVNRFLQDRYELAVAMAVHNNDVPYRNLSFARDVADTMPYAKTTLRFSNEYYLSHATDEDSADRIATRGYDLEQAGRHAQDRGVCVCHNFVTSQCDSYSASDSRTEGVIVVSLVFLGHCVRSVPLTLMPLRTRCPKREGIGDSAYVLGTRSGGPPSDPEYPEIMSYNESYNLPAYLIKYKHAQGCACRKCRQL